MTLPKDQRRERIRLWRPQGLSGVEVAHLVGNTPSPPFFVDSYVLTVVHEVSSSEIHYRRQTHRLESARDLLLTQHPGDLCRIKPSPDQPDDVSFLRVYPEAMERLSVELGFKAPLHFSSYVVPEPFNAALTALTKRTIRALTIPSTQLERDFHLLWLLHALAQLCADAPVYPRPLGKEHRAIRTVKHLLEVRPEQDHTLEGLSQQVGLSRVYLAQVFKRDVGVTPQVYQACVRVARAKALLSVGESAAEVALTSGFFDQSHFTRVFRQYVGVTPGQFQQDKLDLRN